MTESEMENEEAISTAATATTTTLYILHNDNNGVTKEGMELY